MVRMTLNEEIETLIVLEFLIFIPTRDQCDNDMGTKTYLEVFPSNFSTCRRQTLREDERLNKKIYISSLRFFTRNSGHHIWVRSQHRQRHMHLSENQQLRPAQLSNVFLDLGTSDISFVMRAWRFPALKSMTQWGDQCSPVPVSVQTSSFPTLTFWYKYIHTDLCLTYSCCLLKTVHE